MSNTYKPNKNNVKHHASVGGSLTGTTTTQRCHATHPVLKLGKGEIVGAACGTPRAGFDIYIGFDWGMQFHTVLPWDASKYKKLVEFQYKITDGQAPSDPEEFKKMITWVAEQLNAGKRVHCGCIGGHGRTGLFLAALVKEMNGTEDAITWVRENHCKEAVETKAQVQFLMKHYGITEQKTSYETGAKGHKSSAWGGAGTAWSSKYSKYPGDDDDLDGLFDQSSGKGSPKFGSGSTSHTPTNGTNGRRPRAGEQATPMAGPMSIWGT